MVEGAQLGEPPAQIEVSLGPSDDRFEQDHDLAVLPEADEVLVGQVEGSAHRTPPAQVAQLVELATASHVRRAHDSRKGGYWSVTSVPA